jgi:hypothetical protein
MDTYKSINKQETFFCEKCNYKTQTKCNFNKHLLTAKHLDIIKDTKKSIKEDKSIKVVNKEEAPKKFACECGSIYRYSQGLSKHKMKCTFVPTIKTEPVKNDINPSLVLEIIKENQEFKELILMQSSQINKLIEREQASITNNNNTNTNSHNTNSNNTQFNIQFFLNETCKNALNFSEFIENIQVSSDDLENNAKLGFVNGISKLIMDNLKQLELTERPIHCTDAKRDTIYIKEEDQWEKDASKVVLEKGIQEITRKNMCKLSEWREDNPEYQDMESELGEQSILMQQNSMAGVKRDEFYPKIIKNIAKETILDKKMVLE